MSNFENQKTFGTIVINDEHQLILMTSMDGFPPSVILEGPVFRDELRYPPQSIRDTHEIELLRLIPAKSASNGVYGIYFVPEHREWALVRLAKRYRWVLEIQLNRGLSGEQQMLRQGFSDDDLTFLYDIFPEPPNEYNPVVYDMLWRVATFDQYLTLAKAIVESETFTPRELIQSTPGIDTVDTGYFTPFHRSHLIELQESATRDGSSSRPRSELTVDCDKTYTLTTEGESALPGIISEYIRIFEQGDFNPLVINQDLDPVEHLRKFNVDSDIDSPEMSLDILQEDDGILGEIARSFPSMDKNISEESAVEDDQTAFSPEHSVESRPRTSASYSYTISIQDQPHSPVNQSLSLTGSELSTPKRGSSNAEESQSNQETSTNDGIAHTQSTQPEADAAASSLSTSPDAKGDDQYGEFTREEVLQATVAAARMIQSQSVAQTYNVKEAARGAVDLNGRNTGQLWKYVSQALLAMNCVTGRPGGRIWLGLPITPDPIASSDEGAGDS